MGIMYHVRKGAALLDENGPQGWREKIDLDKLDQDSVTRCVLGQVYDNYDSDSYFTDGYNIGREVLGLDIADAGDHGFTASHTAYTSAQFTNAWQRYLESMPPAPKPARIELDASVLQKLVVLSEQLHDPTNPLAVIELEIDGVRVSLI